MTGNDGIMLSVANLTVVYGNIKAVDDISLRFRRARSSR